MAKWLTRDKTWIDGEGLTPDVAVRLEGERYWAGDTAADPSLDEQVAAGVALLLDQPLPTPTATPETTSGASPEAST